MEINIGNNIFHVTPVSSNSTDETTIVNANDYIPEFLSSNERINTITELYNVLISDKGTIFSQIQETYQDGIYKVKDYNKLSYQAKLEVINELGFSYITNILNLSNDKLTKLLTLFNLIYCLKGKDEGLNLVLKMLDLPHTYLPWYVVSNYKGTVSTYTDLPTNPKVGDTYQTLNDGNYYMFNNGSWQLIGSVIEYSTQRTEFTAELVFHSDLTNQQYVNLKQFFRAYMLPWINYNVDYTANNINFYAWGGPGILIELDYSTVFNTSSDAGRTLLVENIHNIKTISQMEVIPVQNYVSGVMPY